MAELTMARAEIEEMARKSMLMGLELLRWRHKPAGVPGLPIGVINVDVFAPHPLIPRMWLAAANMGSALHLLNEHTFPHYALPSFVSVDVSITHTDAGLRITGKVIGEAHTPV